MKLSRLLFIFSFILSTAYAGSPLWTFTPLTATTFSLPTNSTATVQYEVTNQSKKSHTLAWKPIQGVSQNTAGMGICANPFVLGYQQSCVLSLLVDGSLLAGSVVGGPVVCQQGAGSLLCYQPSAVDSLNITRITPVGVATLAVSGSPLLLIQNGPSGTLTITNTSTNITATNITANFTGTALDGNVTETSNTCASVVPGASCTLGYTPGGVSVPPTSFPIAGDNTNTVLAKIAVVAPGDPIGGGIVACVIGGVLDLIASTGDNSSGIVWGGQGTSTGAQSNSDGAANTATIISVLGNNGGIPYAAQICEQYEVDSLGNSPCLPGNICYNDWFLPATDQLNCLYDNRIVVGGFGSNPYWASTESISDPANLAAIVIFLTGITADDTKNSVHGVRCVRHLSV